MAQKIPLVVADVETQLSTAIGVGGETFSIFSATDDDGNALPAGLYCFTIDNGTSNKEFLIGQLNETEVSSVKSVSRQGVETTGAARAHRVGASVIISDFAALQRVADTLRGVLTLDANNPLSYDAEPNLTNREELATYGALLDLVNGGTVSFDNRVVTGVNAGESVEEGDLVYLNTADQEWYKCKADDGATVNGVVVGIALGSGEDGDGIANGVLLEGVYHSSDLTPGDTYYASDTAGELATTAGTIPFPVGIALSATVLLFIPKELSTPTATEKAALAGGNDFGTPDDGNKYITQEYLSSLLPKVTVHTSSGTWNKPENLAYIEVELVGAGGGAGRGTSGGGGGGGYSKKVISADALDATVTITIGTGGSGSASGNGQTGGTTSFGSHLQATGGDGSLGGAFAGGAGGVGSGGDINLVGSAGGSGGGSDTGSGASQNTAGGAGGSSMLGGGGVGGRIDGSTGAGYGGGGGGAGDNGTDGTGGAGAAGVVIIKEFYYIQPS